MKKNLSTEIKIEILKNKKTTLLAQHNSNMTVTTFIFSIAILFIASMQIVFSFVIPIIESKEEASLFIILPSVYTFSIILSVVIFTTIARKKIFKPLEYLIDNIDDAINDLYIRTTKKREKEIDKFIEDIYKNKKVKVYIDK